jgi:hypothetical protein
MYIYRPLTTIPIDQIKTRTPEIENLIKEYQQQNNNTNNQSGGAVASSSSAAMIQLQKELDEALKKSLFFRRRFKNKNKNLLISKMNYKITKIKRAKSNIKDFFFFTCRVVYLKRFSFPGGEKKSQAG